ncbi:protein FAM13A-like [Trematomus bernacchii]|uniref:protein FAM13A-like n=1 Tax=Trematomus bernacchii TaxID=40690 RepID=UPI00146A60B2|nr:protein FAM13A-like [Trematomus bernacchii]
MSLALLSLRMSNPPRREGEGGNRREEGGNRKPTQLQHQRAEPDDGDSKASSLLKLRALEGEGGPSPGSSPDESPPPLGSKGQKSPPSPGETGRGETLALCHSPPPTDENSPPEPLAPPSPTGEGEGGALLQLLSGGPGPLPSPRCLTHSLRFNSDPEAAPSPPCSQQYMCRALDRVDVSEDPGSPSVSFLTRQIQALKKKVRRFEDQFEQDMKYKPTHNDKYSNPEMIRVMGELATARKRLKEMRLRQSVFELKDPDPQSCSGAGQQGAPESLEETVESLFRRLREKRQALNLPDNMKDMTQAQMVLEKITLQKCLLYFESVHGRPGVRQERVLVKPLYDRYQMIKRLLCVSPTITTIEEEDGSDEDSVMVSMTLDPPAEEDVDPTFVSPIVEVKPVQQQADLAVSSLHEASRSQLLQSLRETRGEKKTRRKVLRQFEDEFYRQTGRICQKEDRSPMKEEYQEYKQLKAKLRLLEVLLSKQEVQLGRQEVTKKHM